MQTDLEKISLARNLRRWYSAKQLTSIAERKFENKSAMVWFSRLDGWWLETDNLELFLGSDSRGAKRKLDEL